MFDALSRRQRQLLITVSFVCLFLVLTITLVWVISRPKRPYRPGEEIDGLTADLTRSLPMDYPRITFVDVAKDVGIFYQHFSGKRSIQLPEDMGSGAAWGDYDNDGWLDLFVVNQVGPLTMTIDEIKGSPAHCVLYRNNKNGTFSEVSVQAGVDFRGCGMAAAWGDYNNDGWLDLFISCYGENVFYYNNGDGTFTDKTTQTGLGGQKGFWGGVSWIDFDKNSFLDLYVCGYVKYSYQEDENLTMQYDVDVPASLNPSSFEPERNLFYRNNGA